MRTFVFQASGAAFAAEELADAASEFFCNGDIATFGGHSGSAAPFGAARFRFEGPTSSEGPLVVFCEQLLALRQRLVEHGADRFIMFVERTYIDGCNEELTPREIKLLGKLGCALFYSAKRAS